LSRAENELIAAEILFKISQEEKLQKEFQLEKEFTFYSSVIGHAYYCIFCSAKAILLEEGVKTDLPEVHKKTLEAFKNYIVKTGKLDVELLNIYKKLVLRVEVLLDILEKEKKKRGEFTYQKLSQANLEPAKESLDNASTFYKNILKVLERN
jgi:uncharacterized protein (UPF0332 family)